MIFFSASNAFHFKLYFDTLGNKESFQTAPSTNYRRPNLLVSHGMSTDWLSLELHCLDSEITHVIIAAASTHWLFKVSNCHVQLPVLSKTLFLQVWINHMSQLERYVDDEWCFALNHFTNKSKKNPTFFSLGLLCLFILQRVSVLSAWVTYVIRIPLIVKRQTARLQQKCKKTSTTEEHGFTGLWRALLC